ncbi:adenylate isopentenyltransferase-like protein [Carex littledalei]|uniref:Adenylate isopentenyltransferase-like protein n=1 Tax=Carex littledalei TaxID=544730 RepID=A0A833QTM4_9POAL|nr:adenylate isopentenyltransferase-like protein [Carex littledalei]
MMGATRTGKTHLSIDIAHQFLGEVVNSDKIQLYTGLDITTNKVHVPECTARCTTPPWVSSSRLRTLSRELPSTSNHCNLRRLQPTQTSSDRGRIEVQLHMMRRYNLRGGVENEIDLGYGVKSDLGQRRKKAVV